MTLLGLVVKLKQILVHYKIIEKGTAPYKLDNFSKNTESSRYTIYTTKYYYSTISWYENLPHSTNGM